MDGHSFRIGLDIGITSVGWAVLETDGYGEPKRIADMGVRIFDSAEIPKTGASLAAPRREARTTRRRLRRRRFRIERIKGLLEREGIISKDDISQIYNSHKMKNVYELRCKALDARLSDEELAQVLIHIAKHRGFKSTRKAETESKENGAVLSAVRENKQIMEENHYRTIGEMIFKDEAFRTYTPWSVQEYSFSPRNKAGDYKHTVLRDMLVDEVHMIFDNQRRLGNASASEKLENDYLDIMRAQRSFDMGPGEPSPYGGDMIDKMIGYCTLEPNEKRAAKASYTSERFVLLQKVNNMRLADRYGSQRSLSDEEREKLILTAYSVKNVTYAVVRRKLGIGDNQIFASLSYGRKERDEVEKTRFVKMDDTFAISEKISKNDPSYRFDDLAHISGNELILLDEVGRIITTYKSDDRRKEELNKFCLSDEAVNALLEMNDSKFQNLSLKAMHNIMPYLEQGFVYNEACERAGYDFKADFKGEKLHLLRGDVINDEISEIPNPVVKRSISQTIKVINAIIIKYGSPVAVNIELAREMAKNFDERKKIDKRMKDNEASNEQLVAHLHEMGVNNPTGQDILKFKLWKEQDGICMYSGEPIPIDRLFEKGEADIDHIIPYSMCFNDSFSNKVLVSSKCNREKGNRLPYEYFKASGKDWDKFTLSVEQKVKDSRKRAALLKEEFTEEDRKAFKERNLTDTKYITAVVYNMLRNYLEMAPILGDKRQQVFAVNGSITSFMRKRWGLKPKDRTTDLHHSVDAVIIACCTPGMIKKITRFSQEQELRRSYEERMEDYETHEVITRSACRDKYLPQPWEHFTDEIELRTSPEPGIFMDMHRADFNHIVNYDGELWGKPYDEPIFVSRMPNHKVTGAGHLDTVRSPRHFDDEGIVLSKTAITDLKLDKDGNIDGYYNPASDRLLYEALRQKLIDAGGDGKKAFKEEFRKPKSDGTQGPVVNKVKTYQKQSSGVMLNDKKGIASNGSMVRVDVFCEDKKYYFVPVYTADVVKKRLPNKAAMQGKIYKDWKEMKDDNFLFSLYPKDAFRFEHKKSRGDKKYPGEKDVCYFTGANIATASFGGIAHDSSYDFGSLGIQSLAVLEKYQVDILGEYHKVSHEVRMTFS